MRALVLFLFFTLPAFAADYAVMLNMNYSIAEWEAFQIAAKKCGRVPVSIPPTEMLPAGEALLAKRDRLRQKIAELRPAMKKKDLDIAVEEVMRLGKNWQADPAVANALQPEIQSLYEHTKKFSAYEKEYGSIGEQFADIAQQIREAKSTIGQFAVSAHSDGWNFTGETATSLSWADLDDMMKKNPKIFRNTRHVLLLGCYNMTDNNREHWTSLFPYASMIAGFGVQAPSRSKPVARAYITETLGTACALDDKLAQYGQALNPAYVEQCFKNLASVASTQAVVDYCRQVVEGLPGSRSKLTCDEQWAAALPQAEDLQAKYLDFATMSAEAPDTDDNSSVVKRFYTMLHGLCPASQASQLKGQEEDYERWRRSLKESLVRLRFWSRVQRNFNTYYTRELADLEESLVQGGVTTPLPSFDGSTGRVEFVRTHRKIEQEISALQNKAANSGDKKRYQWLKQAEQQMKVLRPLYYLEGEHSVSKGQKISVEETLRLDAIPFNWIEGTVLAPRSK